MKRFLSFLVLIFCFFMYGQNNNNQIQLLSGSTIVEIGITYNYQIKFVPSYPSGGYNSYEITGYFIKNYFNPGSGSAITGEINGTEFTSGYYAYINLNPYTFTIRWGDWTSNPNDEIYIEVIGVYKKLDNIGNVIETTPISNVTKRISITKRTISIPTISNSSVIDCCQNNVKFTASAGDADIFNWSLTSGTIVSGQGTSILVVTPPSSGVFTATVTAKRASAHPNYSRSNSKLIERTSRSAIFTPLYPEHPYNSQPMEYICKGAGRKMQMQEQCGIVSINWVANGCSIAGQNTFNPTITPDSSTPTGSNVNVYAIVNFIGGCSVTTPTKSFRVLDATNPPLPSGYIRINTNGVDICSAELLDLIFVANNGFGNGVTTITPPAIFGPGDPIHYRPNRSIRVNVCNENLCTGTKVCRYYNIYPPAPCISNYRIGVLSDSEFTISPNPSKGDFVLEFEQEVSGEYSIFNSAGNVVHAGIVNQQKQIIVQLEGKIKQGNYFVVIKTETEQLKEQLIIK